MIRSLRILHRRVFAVLGIALPAAWALGIAGRTPAPVAHSTPAALADSSTSFDEQASRMESAFESAPVTVRLWRERNPGSRLAISLEAASSFVKPDLLVYWSKGGPKPSIGRLPQDAVLLGAFESQRLALPPLNFEPPGTLILYSLADQTVIAESRPLSLYPPKH